jgi:hypothetical protein
MEASVGFTPDFLGGLLVILSMFIIGAVAYAAGRAGLN